MTANALTKGLRPSHPGSILREDVIPALDRPITAIARDLGLSRQQFHDILSERKPITIATALRLGRYLGNGPDLWIALQNKFDLANAEVEMADALAAIPVVERVEELA